MAAAPLDPPIVPPLERSARGAGNKCRNPTANTPNPHPRLWCYAMTTDPAKTWGECAVPIQGRIQGGGAGVAMATPNGGLATPVATPFQF